MDKDTLDWILIGIAGAGTFILAVDTLLKIKSGERYTGEDFYKLDSLKNAMKQMYTRYIRRN